MTSRPSLPRRSSGSSAALTVASLAGATLASLGLAALAFAEAPASDLTFTRGGITVDWRAGTVSASGGAAADLRMPSVDLARPGAERRARAGALAKLRIALGTLLPTGTGRALDPDRIDRALGRARATDLQYQSNGGAVVRMEVGFADWLEDPAAPVTALAVHEAHLGATPAAVIGGQAISIGAATYRVGAAPADAHAHAAHLDHSGRLVVEGGAELAAKLARGPALIYVQKVLR